MKQKTTRRIVCIIVMLSLVIGFLPLLKIQNSFANNSSLMSARINGLSQQNGSSLESVIVGSGVAQVTSIDVISGTVTEADLLTIASHKNTLVSLQVTSSVALSNIPNSFFNATSSQPNTVLQNISLPSVTTIGANAFSYCTALTTVSFDQLTTIGANAFTGCSKLDKLTLGITPPATDATAFMNCTATNKLLYIPTDSIANYDTQDSKTDTLWNGFTIVDNTITATATVTKLDVSKGNIVISETGATGFDATGNAVTESTLNPSGYEVTGTTNEYTISVDALGTQSAPISITLNGVQITAKDEAIPLFTSKASFTNLVLTGENKLLNGGLRGGTVTVQGTGSLNCEGKIATVEKVGGIAIGTEGAFTVLGGSVQAKGGQSTVAVYSGGNAMKVNGLSVLGGTLVAIAGTGTTPDKTGIGIWNLGTTLAIDQNANVTVFGSKSIAFGLSATNGSGMAITSPTPATLFASTLKAPTTQDTVYTITKDTTTATVTVPKDMTSFATTVKIDGVSKLTTGTTAQQHTTIGKTPTADFNVVASKLNYFTNIEPTGGTTPVDPTLKVPTVNLTATPAANSGQVTLAATVTGETATPITGQVKYQVDFIDMITVNIIDGVVPTYNWTPTMAKKYNLTAIYLGDSNYKTVTKSIEHTVPKLIQRSFKFIDTVKTSYTYGDNAFNARAEGTETTGAVTYKSSNDKVLAVDTKGVVTIKGQGTAAITATKAANDMYSEATVTTPTITVNPKELTATATNKSVTVGGTLPTFDVKVTGFVSGETETSLASAGYKAPTAACSATTATAGSYDIVVSGGTSTANYKFKYVNGKFTVSTYTAPTNTVLEHSTTNTTVAMVDGTSFATGITFSVEQVTTTIPTKDMDVYKKNVDAAAKGKAIIKIYDMKLIQNGNEVQPSSKVNVKIKVSSDFDKYKDLQVAYIDKYGKVTLCTTEVKDGYINFTTDHFSNYAVIGTSTVTKNPSTGDSALPIYAVIGGIALAITLAAVLGLCPTKKRKRT